MSESKAPQMIYLLPEFAEPLSQRLEHHYEIAYRRADLPWLPEELVERIRFWSDGWAIYGDGTGVLLRDILAAVEQSGEGKK